jgi:hypothetical protein
MDAAALNTWLQSANDRYRAAELPLKARPFHAMSDFTKQYRCSLGMNSPTAKAIFRWFEEHSPPGAHAVGSMFTGAFYFDTCFWPLHVPIIFGRAKIDALNTLETMPEPLRDELQRSREDMWRLAFYWVDCCDYAYGLDDALKSNTLDLRARDFLVSADAELIGAVSQLLIQRPNTKAILGLRMATEIFLKTLLIQETDVDETRLKRLGHKLSDLAESCFAATAAPDFKDIARNATAFPEINERYDSAEWPLIQVWHAAVIAQATAATIVRKYSGRDMRPQVFGKTKSP